MREILFRGKRADDGEWWYGLPCRTLNKDGEDVLNIQCWERDEEGVRGIYDPVIPETIGQYTGLTDKNGKKIFEGDIVQDVVKPKPKGIVRFGNYKTPYKNWTQISNDIYSKHIGFFIEWYNTNFRKDLGYWNEKIKVIGNIHDNPELLKEREE